MTNCNDSSCTSQNGSTTGALRAPLVVVADTRHVRHPNSHQINEFDSIHAVASIQPASGMSSPIFGVRNVVEGNSPGSTPFPVGTEETITQISTESCTLSYDTSLETLLFTGHHQVEAVTSMNILHRQSIPDNPAQAPRHQGLTGATMAYEPWEMPNPEILPLTGHTEKGPQTSDPIYPFSLEPWQDWFTTFDTEVLIFDPAIRLTPAAPETSQPSSRNLGSRRMETSHPNILFPRQLLANGDLSLVERLWPVKGEAPRAGPAEFWGTVAEANRNLFDDPNIALDPLANAVEERLGSRCVFDETCRSRLISECREATSLSDSTNIVSSVDDFPSSHTLDMCIDSYFRRFHKFMPFIHQPTFSPRRVSASFLLAVCLIGSVTLGSEQARVFAEAYLPVSIFAGIIDYLL